MASYEPLVKNGAAGAIFTLGLPSATVAATMQAAATLAAGDVKISLDNGALANLATLPTVTPAGGKLVKVVLSQAETNADNIAIVFSDQTTPKEWADTIVTIQTVAQNFDSLPTAASIAAIQADTDNLQTRVPAALVGGRMDSNVGSFTAGAITAAAFTAGAIDANAIATDAIGSAELAASAVTEIQAGLATAAAVAAVQADTDDMQTRLPAALVGGKMDSNVATITAGAITAAAIAPDAIGASELAADAVAEIQAGLATAAAVAAIQADTDDIQARLPVTVPSANQNADALLDRVDGVETGLTPRQWLRLAAAVLFGKASGMETTTARFRNTPDTKNRVTATVDGDGNRSAVTLDPS